MKLAERLGPLELALVYQPALIVGFALLLHGLISKPDLRRAIGLVALFGYAVFIVPAIVHDFGIILIYGWPIGAVVAIAALERLARTRPWPAALATLPLLSPFLIFALAIVAGFQSLPSVANAQPATLMAQAVNWNDGNWVRLVRWANPDRVEDFGNNEAYKILEQAASMEPLDRSLLGAGYMTPIHVRGKLIEYQYIDNVTSINLMAPFGRLGMVTVLIFYLAFCFALIREEARPVALSGRMAALTLLWAGLYMTLGNLNLVPFTGRNVYFLAVNSGGDLFEGLAMLVLAVLPWVEPGILEPVWPKPQAAAA
jgi:hypothetical protein